MLRGMAVMALALAGLSMPARAEDVIRLFAPVPAGKIAPLPEHPARRAAYSPPRALVAGAAPAIRGSVSDGEPASTSRTAEAPWMVAPRGAIQRKATAPGPSTAQWQMVGGQTNAAR